MNKPKIAWDIDDVLSDSAAEFVAFSNMKWGTSLSVEDYDDHWAEMWQLDHDETERRALEYHAEADFARYQRTEKSFEVLTDLMPYYEHICITSRRLSIEGVTREWIAEGYPGIFSGVYFAGIFDDSGKDAMRWARTKADLYVLHNVDYVVDDQTKHAFAAAGLGKKALLFREYTWNRVEGGMPSGVVRARDWSQTHEYFLREAGQLAA